MNGKKEFDFIIQMIQNKTSFILILLIIMIIAEPTKIISINHTNSNESPQNFDALLEMFPINETQQKILLTNGFLVLEDRWIKKSSDFYLKILDSSVGVFVTADVMLHLFHILVEDLLIEIEKNSLYDELSGLLWGMYQQTLLDYNSSANNTNIHDAIRRNLIFFGVGTKLLSLSPSIPVEINESITSILQKIANHTLIEYFPGEDYTQYEIRGHYEGDSKLEKYFKALKWVGRRIFRISDVYDPENATMELRQAVLFSLTLWNDKSLRNKWETVYNITSYLANNADSITPTILMDAIITRFGATVNPRCFEADDNITLLQTELAKEIYPSSEIVSVREPFPGRIPSKYVQFLGERYLPDNEVFQNVTFPNTPVRCPSGLEIAATVLGSEKADDLLLEEKIQTPQLDGLLQDARNHFNNLPVEYWDRSMYNNWLQTLRTLTTYEILNTSTYLPWFTQIEPWQALRLNSMLASWTQLRHDIILYGKQTYVPESMNEERGLVEPIAAFWDSLDKMVLAVKQMCYDYVNTETRYRFVEQVGTLRYFCKNFGPMAKKIEQGETLSDGEQSLIHNIGGWLHYFHEYSENEKSPALIADVLTEPNLNVLLHEATAHFNPILIAYRHGREYIAGAGLVFSYYEIKTELSNRISDSEWLEKLIQGDIPERPVWTEEFLSPKLYESPRFTTTHPPESSGSITTHPPESPSSITTHSDSTIATPYYFPIFAIILLVVLQRKLFRKK